MVYHFSLDSTRLWSASSVGLSSNLSIVLAIKLKFSRCRRRWSHWWVYYVDLLLRLCSNLLINIAEEIQDAQKVIPFSIVCSMILNGVTGFAMLMALMFCLGSVEDAVNSDTGYPMIEILVAGVGSKAGGTALVSHLHWDLVSTSHSSTFSRLKSADIPNHSASSSSFGYLSLNHHRLVWFYLPKYFPRSVSLQPHHACSGPSPVRRVSQAPLTLQRWRYSITVQTSP